MEPLTDDIKKQLLCDLRGDLNQLIMEYTDMGSIAYASIGFLKDTINKILAGSTIQCSELRCSNNTDKSFFGVYIAPYIESIDIIKIISGGEAKYSPRTFRMDIDSKMFDGRFLPEEIEAIILFEIYNMTDEINVYKLQRAVAACMVNSNYHNNETHYVILDAVRNNPTLFEYAIITFLRAQYSICVGVEPDVSSCSRYGIMNLLDLNMILSDAYGKVNRMYVASPRDGSLDSISSPLNVLEWAFSIYNNFELHGNDAVDTLRKVMDLTGSELEKDRITKLITAFTTNRNIARADKIISDSLCSESVVVEGFSLFKSLKTNGLRSIEDDLYEYKIRIKNCEEDEEAMYILRQINVRLSVLDDYLHNTDNLSNSEIQRWNGVMDSYRKLRAELGQKKLGPKKQYGIFIDYDKIDQL